MTASDASLPPDPTAVPESSITSQPAEPRGVADSSITALPAPPTSLPVEPVPPPEVKPPRIAWLDRSLVLLVLVLAFLAGSTVVHSSDFFRSLAAGRLVSQGHYPFGTDPFASSMEGIFWVSHSWLFSLLVYLLYQVPQIGPAAVVVVKALLVTLVAELMLRTAVRRGQSLWLPAAGVLLAVVTLSPYLELNSRCASYLGLALVVWLLERSRERPRLAWLVPVVCLVWVNLDDWFWLGPLTTALYLTGTFLRQDTQADRRESSSRLLMGVLAASVVACLLNPNLPQPWRVFELPVEVSPKSYQTGLRDDESFRSRFLTPLQREYLDARAGLSVAGIAYFVLLIATAASFLAVRGRRPIEHLLLALIFAAMSLMHTHLIPFFAIVAGPILAQNFLSWAETLPDRWTLAWRRWALIGRSLTLLAAALLLAACIPGWLQGEPHERHRVGWDVHGNPSLQRAAEQIEQWRESGLVPSGGRWMSFAPEVADYLAWYAPGEQAWVSWSMLTTPEVAEQYLQVRQALQPRSAAALLEEGGAGLREDPNTVWQQFLRDHNLRFLIAYNGGGQPLIEIQYRLLGEPGEWVTCHLQGQVGIFGWLDPQDLAVVLPEPWAAVTNPLTLWDDLEKVAWHPQRLAFGPEAEPAPPDGPDREPTLLAWWEQPWHPAPDTSLDRETAAMHQMRFQAMGPFLRRRQALSWQAMNPAIAIGSAALPGPLSVGTLLSYGCSCAYHDYPMGVRVRNEDLRPIELVALRWRGFLLGTWDDGPPSSLYLGIRAARRATAANPNDPMAHMLLGEAYFRLGWYTREAFLTQTMRQRGDIRLIQATTALNDALSLEPSLQLQHAAHIIRGDLFQRQGYLDLETRERQEQLRCARALGPQPGEDADVFDERIKQLEQAVDAMEKRLTRNRNLFEVQAARRSVGERFQIALRQFGLAETACDLLLRDIEERVDESSQAKLREAARLKLHMGLVEEARQLLTPEGDSGKVQQAALVDPWLYTELALARGRYQQADGYLEAMLALVHKGYLARDVGLRIGKALLTNAPLATRMPWQFHRQLPLLPTVLPPSDLDVLTACRVSLEIQQMEAELHLFRGWIALEAGNIDKAREQLEATLRLAVLPERWGPVVNRLRFVNPEDLDRMEHIARQQEATQKLARLYLDWIQSNR